jgi:predicted MFS family arabinose efflux permease
VCCAILPVAFLVLSVSGASMPAGLAFALLLGASNGLVSIVRGALVLSLFGAKGYGEQMGKVAVAQGLTGAVAPIVFASVLAQWGPDRAVWFCALVSFLGLVVMLLLFRHATRARRAV